MPAVAGRDDLTIAGLSAEHGKILLSPDSAQLEIGDRLELIPGYVDFTTMLHDRFYAFRGDQFEQEITIEARGKVC
jgi:D-serine deaminase-like pyridoxal phosphate-dependent protein